MVLVELIALGCLRSIRYFALAEEAFAHFPIYQVEPAPTEFWR